MARATYWERGVTSSTGGAYSFSGTKFMSPYAAGNTLTRTLWSAAIGGSTESAPGPMKPFMVGLGVYERPAGSGLVLLPFDNADAGNWVSRAMVPMRTLYWTFDPAGALLGGQRIGDTGPHDIESKAQRSDLTAQTEMMFAWQVDSRSQTENRQINYVVSWSFLIMIA